MATGVTIDPDDTVADDEVEFDATFAGSFTKVAGSDITLNAFNVVKAHGSFVLEMREVDVEVGTLRHRHMVELADDVVTRLDKTARERKVSSTDLVNLFLREKLASVR